MEDPMGLPSGWEAAVITACSSLLDSALIARAALSSKLHEASSSERASCHDSTCQPADHSDLSSKIDFEAQSPGSEPSFRSPRASHDAAHTPGPRSPSSHSTDCGQTIRSQLPDNGSCHDHLLPHHSHHPATSSSSPPIVLSLTAATAAGSRCLSHSLSLSLSRSLACVGRRVFTPRVLLASAVAGIAASASISAAVAALLKDPDGRVVDVITRDGPAGNAGDKASALPGWGLPTLSLPLPSLGGGGAAPGEEEGGADGATEGEEGVSRISGERDGDGGRSNGAAAFGENGVDPFSLSELEVEPDEILSSAEDDAAAALPEACLAVSADGVRGGVVVEPRTNTAFPAILCVAGPDPAEEAAGRGSGREGGGRGGGAEEASFLSRLARASVLPGGRGGGGKEGGGGEEGGRDGASSSSNCQLLAGVGFRGRVIANVKTIKVYSFGLYVRPDGIDAALRAKYGRVPAEQLRDSEEFYRDLLRREIGMTVRLVVFYKHLKMEMVQQSFATTLSNRMNKVFGHDDDAGLRAFNEHLNRPRKLRRGSTIDFSWQPGGRFLITIDGQQLDPIVSPNLCRVFFDLYIGDPPVCAEAKQKIGETVARMIAAC